MSIEESLKLDAEVERLMKDVEVHYAVKEGDRQMIVLALAALAMERPGWDDTLGRLATVFNGKEEFEQFKDLRRPNFLDSLEEIR